MKYSIDPGTTGILTIDLQNDFLRPDGAYGGAGQPAGAVAALPAFVTPVIDTMRAVGDAHLRGTDVSLRSDVCAAFDPAVHDATLALPGSVARVMTGGKMLTPIGGAS